MLLESVIDLSLATFVAHVLPWLNDLASWFVVGLSAFDLSDLAVGMVIYLVERTLSRRGHLQSRRVQPRRRARADRIYPTLSPL
jgi:hypothetical protein